MTSLDLLRLIGKQIRSARIEVGMTQSELGSRAGIGGKYVSEIERGTRDLPVSTLYSIVSRGLRFDLDIGFRRRGAAAGDTSLPVDVADMAARIAALPMAMRDRVVRSVRTILELTR